MSLGRDIIFPAALEFFSGIVSASHVCLTFVVNFPEPCEEQLNVDFIFLIRC